MKLLIVGLNHKTAPVEVRERLAFDGEALGGALELLAARGGVSEAIILSTCNRVEIAVTCADGADPHAAVEAFLRDCKQIEPGWAKPYLYRHEDEKAIHHLFRVAASLDSMVVGEPQILGQLKSAYNAARECGTTGGFLDVLLPRAFNVAKRVRSETGIGESAVSVGYAAVELARDIFGALDQKKVMIVGAGKMSELAARHLHNSGASQIWVTNRTRERAVEMAALFNGRVVDYERFQTHLPEIDIVIASSGAPHYILKKADVKKVIDARKNEPVFLIDIAVPRNIEPAVNELDNVFLYDIDDLQQVVGRNVGERKKRAEVAERLVADEVDRMMVRLKAREVVPTIVGLQEQLEQIRVAEIARMRGRLGGLTEQQEEALEALTRGIINKIAHAPIAEIRKQAARPEGTHVIAALRRAFRLEE